MKSPELSSHPIAYTSLEAASNIPERGHNPGEYLISPDQFERLSINIHQELVDKLGRDRFREIAKLANEREKTRNKAIRVYETDGYQAAKSLNNDVDDLDQQLRKCPEYPEYLRLRNDLETISKQDRPETHIRDEDAKSLLDSLIAKGSKGHEKRSAHMFVNNRELDNLYSDELNPRTYLYTGGHSVDIPVGLIVSADSFESWRGRPEHISKNGRPSEEVIKEYANMPEEEAPPVEDMTAYLLPDGRLFFKSGNSHRVGAAIRRQNASGNTVKFDGMMNLVMLPSTPEGL